MSDGQFTINLDKERGLVYVIVQGDFDRKLGEEIITKARLKAAEYQYQILCDVRQSKAKVALADWFFLPRTLAVYNKSKTRFLRTALLVNAGDQESVYKFFETVTQNLGLNIRIFFHEKDALEWLGKVKLDDRR